MFCCLISLAHIRIINFSHFYLCVFQDWVELLATWWERWTGATLFSVVFWAPSTKSSTSSRHSPGASSSPCTCLAFQNNLCARTPQCLTAPLPVPSAYWAPTAMVTEHSVRSPALPQPPHLFQTSGQDPIQLWAKGLDPSQLWEKLTQ